MLKKLIFCIGCAGMVLNGLQSAVAQEAAVVAQLQEEVSVSQAKDWLAILDQGKYAESWDEASAYFKSMITKELWAAQVEGVRKPLGGLVSRSLGSKQYMEALPGAPDGDYYVLTFNTVLENKASGIETVTVMKDQDGQWRLAGYFIK